MEGLLSPDRNLHCLPPPPPPPHRPPWHRHHPLLLHMREICTYQTYMNYFFYLILCSAYDVEYLCMAVGMIEVSSDPK